MGSMIPRWFNRLPSPLKNWKSGDLGKVFQDLDEGYNWFSSGSGLCIYSDEKTLTVEADVPGLTAKDIEVSMDPDGVVCIKGERKLEEKGKGKTIYRKAQQSFSYCLPLGDEVDLSQEPFASCKDGVMKIIFQKKQEKQKELKKIKIQGE